MEEPPLPPRMFAAGDEPLGERVNSYHRLKRTEALIKALEPEELEFFRKSTFGKLLAVDENPPFSGAFGQYVVVRLLKVNKKYEVWFLFAGNPIRMSLREFAIVTGLSCGQLPEPIKRKKNPLKEKLYWNELLGSLKFCTVDTAIEMLKNKVVKTKEARIKFACLAITSSILFPSSHSPRIIPEHVELIRDLDEFLAFPWGRAAYHTLVTSLVAKDETALSQVSFAIRGYVEAIQLVFLAAIPQLKEEITYSEPVVIADSDSDGETAIAESASEEDNNVGPEKPQQGPRYCLIPGHAKNADNDCQLPVKCILDDPYEGWSALHDFTWFDESEDLSVDYMVRLISEGFIFRKEMFKGGLTAPDLARRRAVKKLKEKEPKEKGENDHVLEATDGESAEPMRAPPSVILDQISLLEKRISQALVSKLEKIVASTSQAQQVAFIQSTISRSLEGLDKKIGDAIAGQMKTMQAALTKVLFDVTGKQCPTTISEDQATFGRVPLFETSRLPENGRTLAVDDTSIPSEAADTRINEVLHDLNVLTDVFPPAGHTQSTVEHEEPPEQANINTAEINQSVDDNTVVEQAIQDNIESVAVEDTLIDVPVFHDVEMEDAIILPAVQQEEVDNSMEQVVEELETTDNTVQADISLNANQLPEQGNNPSGVLQSTVVNEPFAEEVEMEEEEASHEEVAANPLNYVSPSMEDEVEVVEKRKSKRNRKNPVGLLDYNCDPKVTGGVPIIPDLDHRFLRMQETVLKQPSITLPSGYCVAAGELCDIGHRTSLLPTGVVDALIGCLSRESDATPNVAIYDTTLPAGLMNHHSRFVRTSVKDRMKLKFPNLPMEKHDDKTPERIYFPFNMDKTHWVGVCIDTKACSLHVMDCNTSKRTETSLKKELTPIANLIPYVLKQVGFIEYNGAVKPFTVSRCKGIPQISSVNDAAVMMLLLIEAHARDGLAGCKAITPRLLPDLAKQLAVKFFDYLSK